MITWSETGVTGLHLPEADEAPSLARLNRGWPDPEAASPTTAVAESIDRVTAFLSGREDSDLAAIPLDSSRVSEWEWRVYQCARSIPVGQTLTYSELAASLGDPTKARSVGQALGRNPWPIIIPCHRITASGGGMGGFSAPGGRSTKRRLLELEGAFALESLPLFAS